MTATTPILNREKAINAILYIAKRVDKPDMHKLFKLLYFADRDHILKYGRFISGDTYIKMTYGPVPTWLYDEIKQNNNPNIKKYNSYCIEALVDADMDVLSQSDIEALDSVIEQNGKMTMNQLTELSHGSAWNSTTESGSISVESILQEAGTEEDFIKHICTQITLQRYA